MDSRLTELQQVIFKKDLMILQLQRQLQAYETHFGTLDPEVLEAIEKEESVVTTSTPTAASPASPAKVDPLSNSSNAGVIKTSSQYNINSSNPADPATIPAATGTSEERDISFHPPVTPRSDASSSISSAAGKNVVLDFVEDSPMFRRQLEGFEESLTGLRTLLKEILARTKDYVASGVRHGEDETAIAEEIVHRKYSRALFTTSCPELGSLSSLFNDVHDTITQIQSSRTSMLLSVEALLHHAVVKFNENELKEAGDLRKEVTRLADEYESQLGKLLGKSKQSGGSNGAISTALTPSDPTNILGGQLNSSFIGSPAVNSGSNGVFSVSTDFSNNTKPASGKSLEREVMQARYKFEMARFDLVRYLNRIDCQKKFLLIECFNSALYAFLGHFHACHELIKSVEPALRQRQETLQQSKEDFESDDRMWAAQREALEIRLKMDVDNAGTDSIVAISSTGNTPRAASARSFDLPVEVISQDTLNSRETHPGCIIKQGYLFVRNTMFPARSWKRRWFQIHSGKLYQNRGKHMDLVLVCDLMLSRVKESSLSSNLPFCFEVIDASQAKYLLQATSESDMIDWIEAARKSTESMLEKQSHRMVVHPEQQKVIQELVTKNPSCADCAQVPSEWVSINIGSFLCIECSGIHRSLGVHVSKVRSLTLDSWEMPLLMLLRDYLGNEVVNSIWEHTIPNGWTKLTPTSTRDEKAKYIKAKYHFHGFAEFSDLQSDEITTRFIEGSRRGEIHELMWCLAHGVDVNIRNARGETALHACASVGASHCCDYLILNGASLVLADANGKLPYEAAKAGGFEAIKLALMQKMSLEQYNSDG